MNWLDLIIVLIVTIPTFFGFRRGFLRKFLGIVGIIVGFVLAVKFYGPVANLINSLFSGNHLVGDVIAFLLIIGVVYGLAVWLSRFMTGMNSGTSLLDKVAGTVFGFIQGLIITSVLLFNLSYINIPDVKVRESSILYSRVYNIAPYLFDKIISFSPQLKEIYQDYKQKFLPSK